MPSGNRVEQLEKEVAELEATVQGLTEELVEANERIRQIEAALGGDGDATLEGTGFDEAEETADEQFEIEEGADLSAVAEAAAEAADSDKGGDDDSGDEGEQDDIIVA